MMIKEANEEACSRLQLPIRRASLMFHIECS